MLTVEPIGCVVGGRTEPFDDDWDTVTATIRLDDRFPTDALLGLDAFSHLEVLYHFHRATEVHTGARHPRGNTDWPRVGSSCRAARSASPRGAAS